MMKTDKNKFLRRIFMFVLVLIIGCLSISAHSLWMDEGLRVGYTNISVEQGYFKYSWTNLHVGLVHYMYLWGALIGTTEVAFRAMNLPFLFLAAAYMVMMLRSLKLSPWWVLLFAAHPLTVYYMNDVGPYVALIGCSCAVTYHCFFAKNLNSKLNTAAVFFWLLLGFAMHFTFFFICVFYLYALILRLYRGRKWNIFLKDLAVGCVFLPFFLYIAWMYFLNMPDGKQLGMSSPGILNITTVGYCFLGLAGLGIPRNEMKYAGLQAFTPLMLTFVSLFCINFLILFSSNLRYLWSRIKANQVFVATAVVAIVFFVTALLKSFRFWERHVIFLFPVFFLLLAILFQHAWQNRMCRVGRIAVVLMGALLLTSSSRLRWYEPYRKDDYKSMLLYLKEQGGLNGSIPVLAQGDYWVYHYYGITFANNRLPLCPDSVYDIRSLSSEQIIHAVDELSRYYSHVFLVLHEKKTKTPELYSNAVSIFMEKGYTVTSTSQYNTFKVMIIERAAH